jgi:hypothetical protein
MGKWKFSFPIDGLHDVIQQNDPKKSPTIQIDEVLFHYDEDNQRVGTVTIEANTMEEAEEESKYLIDKALGKICFAFNTEASIFSDPYYEDLSSNQKHISGSLGLRWSYVKEDSNMTLTKINSVQPDKKDILDLALAYYKLGEYKNPLRIESFFSSMTVLIRDIWKNELPKNEKVITSFLKAKINLILEERDPKIFEKTTFDDLWNEYYIEERCSIVHGKGSKLIDPRTVRKYDEMTSKIGYWAREVIYYYIDNFQDPK